MLLCGGSRKGSISDYSPVNRPIEWLPKKKNCLHSGWFSVGFSFLMLFTAVYSFTSHVRSLDLNRNKSVTEISLTYTDPFLLEQIRYNNHLIKTFKAMWIKSSPLMSVNSIGHRASRTKVLKDAPHGQVKQSPWCCFWVTVRAATKEADGAHWAALNGPKWTPVGGCLWEDLWLRVTLSSAAFML